MATIDPTGIKISTVQQWKTYLEVIYKLVDPEWDVSTNTPDGQIIAAFAEMLANADEAILDSYNAADPDKAMGQALDAILSLSNAQRRQATTSTATVTLTGLNGTLVPAGTLIENAVTGTRWATNSSTTIGASPTSAAVTCTEPGANTAAIGELTKIVNPIAGLASVTNAAGASVGLDRMTDREARLFREETISRPGSNALDAISAEVASVTGVSHVAAYSNRTASVDSNGLPAHSFSIIAKGGTDADVAQAIYDKLPPGPAMHGGTNPVSLAVASDVNTNTETIVFGRPTDVPLYVTVNIKQTNGFTDDQKDAIKQAMVDYSNGKLFDDDTTAGFTQRPWKIGEDIDSGILYTPANYIVGKTGGGYVTSINLGTSPTPPAPSTVTVAWDSLATVDVANISIVVT